MRAFEAAIRGGLPSAQMPRLLYYRGLVFRKLGKPGFAVSDLTSALWLKNGLSEAERADATKMRALAFHEAGISDVPAVPQSSYAEAPALPGQSTPAAGTQTASAGGAPAPARPMPPRHPRPPRARAASAASSRVCSAAAHRAKRSHLSRRRPPPHRSPTRRPRRQRRVGRHDGSRRPGRSGAGAARSRNRIAVCHAGRLRRKAARVGNGCRSRGALRAVGQVPPAGGSRPFALGGRGAGRSACRPPCRAARRAQAGGR